jgi:hypothetical protein
LANRISKCHICSKFFASRKELKDHIDKIHRITNYMAVTSSEAERIVDGILSSNDEILFIPVIDRSGNILPLNLESLLKNDLG